MKKIFHTLSIITFCSILFLACSKPENKANDNNTNGFDKTAMLTNYADNIIIPRYKNLQTQINTLQNAVNAFADAPSVALQNELKTAYTAAHIAFVQVGTFKFGPAENVLLDQFLNFTGGLDYNFSTSGDLTGFSIDTAQIEKNISSGVYNFSAQTRSSFYAQGFPAINYLCFADDAISKASGRKTYIKDVANRMKILVDNVVLEWANYRAEFVSNTKTNVGSPIGNMVNQLAYQLDVLKGPRIGWPFGKQSGGIIFANKVEALYAGISMQLAVASIENLKSTYTANASGKGISDYLIALDKVTLNNDVIAQIDVTTEKLKTIPDPLSNSLYSNTGDVDAAYKEIQKLVTFFKTDVASATGVQINFLDNDGD